ncbi:hypothetical protein PSM36_0020 [Proteiniphilum saccharofermentans]|uniref:Uncharacterized protein n=1 Tax=Proteiniphilum saccharofermentans TaxID=1642647 RepID=A0A1R3SR06_9BACT|nr:hypothetical protein PSM36_0020 [Proteiniphilum saccharofermentans]
MFYNIFLRLVQIMLLQYRTIPGFVTKYSDFILGFGT